MINHHGARRKLFEDLVGEFFGGTSQSQPGFRSGISFSAETDRIGVGAKQDHEFAAAWKRMRETGVITTADITNRTRSSWEQGRRAWQAIEEYRRKTLCIQPTTAARNDVG